jgi:NDP-sugar pyrophosphorylase family protein
VQAVVLAAGFGTRLAPFTARSPKILAPLGGSTLLEHQVRYLARQGVDEIVVNAHHRAGAVVRAVAEGSWPVPVTVAVEPELLGTAGALLPLRERLREPFLVLYGDVVTDLALADAVRRHEDTGAVATICCYEARSWQGKGVLELTHDGRVRSFREKPSRVPRHAYASTGVYVLSRAVLAAIGPGEDFGHDVLPRLVAAGARVFGYRYGGTVVDAGTPEGLAAASAYVAAATGRALAR